MAKKTEKTKKTGPKKTAAKVSPKKMTAKTSPKKTTTKASPRTKRTATTPRATTKIRAARNYDPARDYAAARKLLTQSRSNSNSGGAVVGGTDPCACGYAPEEHGHDADHPSWTGCVEGDCAAYEADPGSSD